jgi:hypothetical protein
MGARLILFTAAMVTGVYCRAQVLENGQRAGLIQATASLYPSWMLNHDVRNNYIGGHFAYYFEDNYSFRGEALVYIDAQGENKVINDHVQLQVGFGRHFPIKRFDPFVYGQMGLAAIQLQGTSQRYFQPVIGLTAGAHYNVSRFFYFFAETSYMHMPNPARTGKLDQLMVSGGLGFQFPTRK